ncbi:hypothetical protein Hanom_Chr08g00747301 [Helianthus anomalus]
MEDDILRKQIGIHGTDKYDFLFFKSHKVFENRLMMSVIYSWAIVASKFKDKSTRQCRRR